MRSKLYLYAPSDVGRMHASFYKITWLTTSSKYTSKLNLPLQPPPLPSTPYNTGTLPGSPHSPNSRLMLSPLCILRMLSAIVGLMSMATSFGQSALCCSCGTVLVTWRLRRWLVRGGRVEVGG